MNEKKIVIHPTPDIVIHELNNIRDQQLAAIAMKLMDEHRRGYHPSYAKRRDCPLCVKGQ